jgi:hypothetical protein
VVTGYDQPLNTFGAPNLRFPRSDILCGPKDFPLAPRDYLLLLLHGKRCHVGGCRDGHRATLNGLN